MKRSEIVKEARSWIGTKWQHQASLKGVATDCVGLARGVYEAATGTPVVGEWNYPATWHLYHAEEKLYSELKALCQEVPIAEAKAGNILIFGFGKGPANHVAIMATSDTMVHAWTDIGKVVEGRIDDFAEKNIRWRDNLRAAFQFQGVEDDDKGAA